MNFDFSEEQKELQRSARRTLERHCPVSAVRAILDGPEPFDRTLWVTLAEMGFCGAAIPEDFGGLGLGYLELCVIAEELGRSLAPVPFNSTVGLFAELLKHSGSDEQKSKYLPGVAQGSRIGTLAHLESNGGAPNTIKAAVSNGKLSGVKCPVPDGGGADSAVVLAYEEQDAAPSLFLVDLASDTVHREQIATLDSSRKYARLIFNKTPAERLGTRGDGLETISRVFDRAAVLVAFQQVGGAERALASGAAELPVAAAVARVSATTAFQHCSTNNIQIHGAIGFTWQHDCHLFYRRSNLLALSLGPMSRWEEKMIDRMRNRNAA